MIREFFICQATNISRRVAETLAKDPGICTMDRPIQEKVLARYLKEYGFVELAYITDRHGRQVTANVCREDMVKQHRGENGYGRDWSQKRVVSGS